MHTAQCANVYKNRPQSSSPLTCIKLQSMITNVLKAMPRNSIVQTNLQVLPVSGYHAL